LHTRFIHASPSTIIQQLNIFSSTTINMQFSAIVLAGFAALASAQTFTGSTVSPTAAAPTGCATTYPGTFELSVVNVTKTSKVKRATSPNSLVIKLANSVLTDNQGRVGYIASNYQFQFDAGGQAGELYNAGFSVCSNNTLALGGSAIFYECLSGDFYNLYDRNWAPQCQPIYLEIIPESSSASATTTTASQSSAGQSAATSVSATTTSAAVVSSITDGQPQGGSTSAIVSSVSVITSVSSTTSAAAVITSITDHQIQAPTATSVVAYTGAAAMPTMAAQIVLAVAGVAAALL
jgi:hypothetical protein